jgi:dTDP-4-dehydrorhamnose 3,5-epimerase
VSAGNFALEPTALEGLVAVNTRAFEDARGWFFESWREDSFRALGLDLRFVQENQSRSRKGALRGLHWQDPSAPQGKLVRCTRGAVWDAAVDLRVGSPTFGRHHGETLSERDRRFLWVPPGFAHGFLALEEDSEVQYLCTGYWDRSAERCMAWNDPDLAIPWPLRGDPVVSEKDRRGMSLRDYERAPSFRHGGAAR